MEILISLVNTLIFKICLGIFLTLLSVVLVIGILSTKKLTTLIKKITTLTKKLITLTKEKLTTLTEKHPRRLLAAGSIAILFELLLLCKIVFLYPHNYVSLFITGVILIMFPAILVIGNTFIKVNKSSHFTNFIVKLLVLIGFSLMTSSIIAVTANILIDIIAIHGQHLTAKDYILSILYPFIVGFVLQVFPSDETKETSTKIKNTNNKVEDIDKKVKEINDKLDRLIKSGDSEK